MRWLLILAIVLPLAAQPAKTPKNKGTAEANSTQSAPHTEQTKNDQKQATQPAPAPAQAPVVTEGKGNPATANHATGANNQQTSDDDLRIQRKLALFTGALVVVGVLQTIVMYLTWRIYRRQAHEMRRQRHEMRRQRHVMYRQWKAMRAQLGQMESAGEQTDKLIEHAENQANAMLEVAEIGISQARASLLIAEATLKSAEATLKSADAAKKSADALVNSERAWITVNIRWTQGKVFFVHSTTIDGPGSTASDTTGVDIDLLYANEGRSPAWIVEEKIRLEVVLSPAWSPSLDASDTQFNERYELVGVGQQSANRWRIFGKGWNDSHAYVYGFIKYRDIFTPPPEEPRETWFGFRVSANGNMGRILSYEYNRVT